MQQRVHPGMSSSQNHKTAHYGAVTGLRTTTDGMHLLSSGWVNLFSVTYLLICLKLACSALDDCLSLNELRRCYHFSSGSDSRLRLWDIDSGCNTLVNFEAMRLQTSKPLQLAVTDDPSLVFIPCMSSIKVCCYFFSLVASFCILKFTSYHYTCLGIQYLVWYYISDIPWTLWPCKLLLLQLTRPSNIFLYCPLLSFSVLTYIVFLNIQECRNSTLVAMIDKFLCGLRRLQLSLKWYEIHVLASLYNFGASF